MGGPAIPNINVLSVAARIVMDFAMWLDLHGDPKRRVQPPFTTWPPFITKVTCSRVRTSVSGSASTAIRSA